MASQIEIVLVFQRYEDHEDTDHIPSVMDELPNLGDRFTYANQRWQVVEIEPAELGFPPYIYLDEEDAPPRA